MMDERAAMLDLDGTLVDSNYEHVRAWHAAFLNEGIVLPQARIHRAIGMGGDRLVPNLLRCPEDDPRVASISAAHDAIFRRAYLDGIQPLPGVGPLLERLALDGYRVALGTSSRPDELQHYIELLGIGDYLDVAVSKAEVGRSKPAPEIFALACDKLGIPPERSIALGDSVWDGESARKLGLPFVGLFSGGFAAEELRGVGALAVYEDLPTLLAVWDVSPFGLRPAPALAAES